MGLNDIHSLSHSKWNCKYHVVLSLEKSFSSWRNGRWPVAVDCGGKFGATDLFATRKWNLGGKQSGRARFATGVKLEKLGDDRWLLIVVAILVLRVYLPPGSGIRVANGVVDADLPPE